MVGLEPQLAHGDGPDLLLGHGDGSPLEDLVGEAGAVPGPAHRLGILCQQHGEVGKGLLRQLHRRAGDDALIGVAQLLPHRHPDLPQATAGQLLTNILRLGGSAGEGEGLGMLLDLPHGVVAAAVGADDMGILPGGAESGAEVGEGGYAGDGLHLTALQQLPELLGPAVKAGVAGEEDGHVLPLLFDAVGDVVGGDEGHAGVALPPGLQEPGGADEHRAGLDGLPGRQGQGVRVAHAHADEIDLHVPSSPSSLRWISSRVSPVSFRGRSTTRRAQPASLAASALARKPP